ncbi:MAG: shikimate kinase [Flavipsychrobacter sp.]|jgi:shikimate kinase|nr:shikimate kinase [Flavipsychrobacter sp.]
MPATKSIFLIGMPGVGKTYWGKKIAQAYGLPFIDLDSLIAECEQATIPELFAQYGEIGFRQKEHEYLKKLVEGTENGIVACGGGTPCFGDNLQLMKENGFVAYLEADTLYLLNNLKNDTQVRPLLQTGSDLVATLEEMLNARKSFYEQAHYILHAKDISISTFAEMISLCTNRQ